MATALVKELLMSSQNLNTLGDIVVDIAKGVIGPLVTVILAWAVGNRLSASWAWWQKRREQAQASAGDLFKLYGEFFAVWKLWNLALNKGETEQCWKLLERAAAAEASMEALLVKIACQASVTS